MNEPELSRFDFHVVRFMNSEDVQRMDATEVGQFILLLCQAWLLGKDATLPNDPKLLAKYSRVEQVSTLVMSKFHPIDTQWGTRLHSPRLSAEWGTAVQRSRDFSQMGKKGAETRWAKDGSRHAQAMAAANGSTMAHIIPTQSVSTQTESEEGKKERVNGSAVSQPLIPEQTGNPVEGRDVTGNSALHADTQPLCARVESLCRKRQTDCWPKLASDLLSDWTLGVLTDMVEAGLADPFWTTRITGMEALYRFLKSDKERGLASWYFGQKRKKEADAKKSAPESTKAGGSKW